jgi:energy-coupling factor transporter ATP-binding protein EcfA2
MGHQLSEIKIEANHLTCSYPGSAAPALRDVSFAIEQGDFVILTGHQGCGISTLCNCLAGLIPHHIFARLNGKVTIDHRKTTDYSSIELVQEVGIVLQVPENQLLFLTVEEEVFFGLENLCLQREEILRLTDEALDLVGLGEHKKRRVSTLSGGQKQRLALAAILAMKPDVLVLDEPVAGLDPLGRKQVLASIKKLNKDQGITVVLAEKRLDDVVHLANKILVLKNGEIASQGEPREILYELDPRTIHIPQVVRLFRECSGHTFGSSRPLTVDEGLESLIPYFEHRKNLEKACCEESDEVATKDVVINTENLSYSYPSGLQALKQIGLEIRKGEFVSILGQNGSGKSTLSKCLNGLLRPTTGKVTINGVDTRNSTPGELARVIAYVFQNPDLQILEKTMEDEIALAPKVLGLPEAQINSIVAENVARLKLEGLEKEDTFFLSRGLRQRVAIASALSLGSEILVLDEPTTGQGSSEAEDIMTLLKNLNKKGYTILVVTHDISLAAEYTNRFIVLHQGCKIADGPAGEILQQTRLLLTTFIEPPQITRISQKLGLYGVRPDIVTVDEFLSQTQILNGGERLWR